MGPRGLFFVIIFGLFNQIIHQILHQINVINLHLVHSAGIQTHDLLIMSLLPQPLDQGSRHMYYVTFSNKIYEIYLFEENIFPTYLPHRYDYFQKDLFTSLLSFQQQQQLVQIRPFSIRRTAYFNGLKCVGLLHSHIIVWTKSSVTRCWKKCCPILTKVAQKVGLAAFISWLVCFKIAQLSLNTFVIKFESWLFWVFTMIDAIFIGHIFIVVNVLVMNK